MRRRRGRRRPVVTVVVTVAALVVAAAVAGGGYLLLHTKGSPQQAAARYLADWQRDDYSAMDQVSVNVPRSGLAGPLRQAAAQLGVRRLRLVPGPVTVSGGSAQARFTAAASLSSGHVWTYARPAAAGPAGPALVGELEPGRDLPIAPAGRAVRAQRRVAAPGPGARRRRHRAELGPGHRGVRVHLAAHRERGRRHRRAGQGAGARLPGR